MQELRRGLWEIVKFALVVLVIVLSIRYYVAQPFIVSGASMYPTFHDHEYLFVDELSYHLRAPERGEVVIFRPPQDPEKFYIKRIIGLPGETVNINGREVSVTKDGETIKIEEPYLRQEFSDQATLTLSPTEYFVMGDNRSVSSDSRAWGALPAKNITGRAFLRLFPFNRLSFLPGHA
jgi:signal peptidase I